VGKPSVAGVCTNQRLDLSKPWEGTRRICQGLEPDPGNPAVRDFRVASRNVRHGETVNLQPKEQDRKPLIYTGARSISIRTVGIIRSPVLDPTRLSGASILRDCREHPRPCRDTHACSRHNLPPAAEQ
jgi:hypothetical protein